MKTLHSPLKYNHPLFIRLLTTILLGLLLFPNPGLSQGESDQWIFNVRVGLHFAPGASDPSPIAANQGNSMIMHSGAASACISDPCGNLLFVATSQAIYDKNLTLMPNGSLTTVAQLSTQMIIVPQPGSSTIYYVFYELFFVNTPPVRYYSIVDLSLNGGLGAVTMKNVPIVTYGSIAGASTLHANGEDIWVVSLTSDSAAIVAHLLTNTGLQPPVISNYTSSGLDSLRIVGRMKFSPDGTKLAFSKLAEGECLLFDFDPQTGICSNELDMGAVASPPVANSTMFYPIEFSPSGDRLYRGVWDGQSPADLVQFDLTQPTPALIQGSGVSIGPLFQPPLSPNVGSYICFQAAKDGRIYVLDGYANTLVHRIDEPNALGTACNFQYEYTTLGVLFTPIRPSRLPYFPWYMMRENHISNSVGGSPIEVCAQTFFTMKISNTWRLDSVVWDFGIPGMAPITELTDSTIIQFPSAGIYPVQALVFRECPTRADTILDTVIVLDSPNPGFPEDTAFCQGGSLPLDATVSGGSYLWQNGSTNPSFVANQAGLYWVEVTNGCGTSRDSVNLSIHQPGNISLGPSPSFLCQGDSISISLSLDQGTYLWEDGSTLAQRSITQAGLYWVEAGNACSTVRDSLEVFPLDLPTTDLGPDTAFCDGGTISLSADAPHGSILWSDGSFDPSLSISTTGTYSVIAQNDCAVLYDTITVEVHQPPVIDLGPDQLRCGNDPAILDATFPFASYVWDNGATTGTRSIDQNGTYYVSVTTACGTQSDTITLQFEPPPSLDLGPDTTLCPGEQIMLIAPDINNALYTWSTGESTSSIQVSTDGTYILSLEVGICEVSDTVNVIELTLPVVELGQDTILCDGTSLVLSARQPGGTSYLWSNGSTAPEIDIFTVGIYSVVLDVRCGWTASDTISIQTGINPDIDLGLDRTACTGDTVWLDASTDFATYLWQDGSEEAQVGATQSDLYQVSVSTVCGTATEDVFLDFLDLPQLNLGPDTLICEGEFYILEASTVTTPSRTLTTIQWPDGSSSPEYVFSEPGAYQVLALNDCGETADTLLLQFRDCDCHVYVASAFSPNGDGHNEVFTPGLSCDFTDYQFSIYHRWGKQVFTTADPSQGWNGLNAPEGVYAWTVSYRWIGRGGVEVGEVRSGTVVLGR